MRRKDLILIVGVAIIAAIASTFLSGVIFNPPKKQVKVTIIDKVDSSFPDVKSDPSYSNFLNKDALDLTQPIQIGNTNNNSPFNAGQ